jgi:hypothetical protein
MKVDRVPLGVLEVWSWDPVVNPTGLHVVSLDGVAGEIVCLDCGGSGVFAEPGLGPDFCVKCKGEGRMLVSI